MMAEFLESFRILWDVPVKRRYFVPLIRVALRLPEAKLSQAEERAPGADRRLQDRLALQRHLEEVCDRYAGEHAYAVLGAMTEIASHPIHSQALRRDRHGLQKLAGEWMIAFKGLCLDPSYTIREYVEKQAGARSA